MPRLAKTVIPCGARAGDWGFSTTSIVAVSLTAAKAAKADYVTNIFRGVIGTVDPGSPVQTLYDNGNNFGGGNLVGDPFTAARIQSGQI
jgi:hypothetical protein